MPCRGRNTSFWNVSHDGNTVGQVTSAVYSPRLKKNIALAMVAVEAAELGTTLQVFTHTGETTATVVERPFFDPRKSLAATGAADAAQVSA